MMMEVIDSEGRERESETAGYECERLWLALFRVLGLHEENEEEEQEEGEGCFWHHVPRMHGKKRKVGRVMEGGGVLRFGPGSQPGPLGRKEGKKGKRKEEGAGLRLLGLGRKA